MKMTINAEATGEITFTPDEHEARNVMVVENVLRGLVDAEGEPLYDPIYIHMLACAVVSGDVKQWVEAGATLDLEWLQKDGQDIWTPAPTEE